jgi:uracil-DNA glycosylase
MSVEIVLDSVPYGYSTTSIQEFLEENGYPTGWEEFFEKNKNLLLEISKKIQSLSKEGKRIYPNFEKIFRIYYSLPPQKISVIILGQDPYHDGSAVGYAFSVKSGRTLNSSMLNIRKELQNEGFTVASGKGDLTSWVNQGVFLLNTALTVFEGEPESHLDVWKEFTEATIKYITRINKQTVLMLFGKKAQAFISCISCYKTHKVIQTPHPSGFSAYSGFLNSNCFKRCNDFLEKADKNRIDFSIV